MEYPCLKPRTQMDTQDYHSSMVKGMEATLSHKLDWVQNSQANIPQHRWEGKTAKLPSIANATQKYSPVPVRKPFWSSSEITGKAVQHHLEIYFLSHWYKHTHEAMQKADCWPYVRHIRTLKKVDNWKVSDRSFIKLALCTVQNNAC